MNYFSDIEAKYCNCILYTDCFACFVRRKKTSILSVGRFSGHNNCRLSHVVVNVHAIAAVRFWVYWLIQMA